MHVGTLCVYLLARTVVETSNLSHGLLKKMAAVIYCVAWIIHRNPDKDLKQCINDKKGVFTVKNKHVNQIPFFRLHTEINRDLEIELDYKHTSKDCGLIYKLDGRKITSSGWTETPKRFLDWNRKPNINIMV